MHCGDRGFESFDPFNHGTTSIVYAGSSAKSIQEISRVLEEGWGIEDPQNVEQMVVGPLREERYFRFSHQKKGHFFKRNRPPIARQLLIDKTREYCGERGIVTTRSIVSIDGRTSYLDVDSDSTYSLARFLDGEHFNGSRYELAQVALVTAKMHRLFAVVPFADEIRSRRFNLKHNSQNLESHLDRLKMGISKGQITVLPMEVAEVAEISAKVERELPDDIRLQVVHMDLHPHNVLFNPISNKLMAVVDFEQVRISQRIRDIGFAMHRFARTYGSLTERGLDLGVDIRTRANLFLDKYTSINTISDLELKSLVLVLQDEALERVGIVLGGFYDFGSSAMAAELAKQMTILREAEIYTCLVS